MIKRPAMTLIEVVASTMIVGMLAVATLNGLGAATRSADSIGKRAIAAGLADELMSEVCQARYKDPTQTPVFGTESGEAAVRSAFDDVDDYDNWSQSPPQDRNGAVIPDRTDWRQRVDVRLARSDDLTQNSVSDVGIKRIRVRIEYRGVILADQYAIRTDTDTNQ